MEREKKIVDASVLVKLFSIEEDSNKAEYLIKNHVTEKIILIIPELLFLEVSNALKYKKNDFLLNIQLYLNLLQLKIILLKLMHQLSSFLSPFSYNFNTSPFSFKDTRFSYFICII